jgi:putative oxidoreductase
MRRLHFPAVPYARDLAPLALRLAVGTVMVAHGYPKFQRGATSFGASLEARAFPFPELLAYAVIVIEVIGGLLLLVGLLTRVWSALIALQMLLTTLFVKRDVGLIAPEGGGTGFELDILILAGAVAVTLLGPGTVSADRALRIDGDVEKAALRNA